MAASVGSCSSSDSPNASATDAYVRSSCVGPIPPEQKTRSCAADSLFADSAIVDGSSGIVSARERTAPRAKRNFASVCEFVSSVLPVRISSLQDIYRS